ncbi:MAG: hypothetical protein JXA21_16115 [Anaerolineae bacterium]|nr:hypothetical protein [Anaerolineae bacterium]
MPAEYGEALSEREIEIVELVAEGLTNREIATRVFLSPNTVKVHLRNIFSKTGVASRTELTVLAIQEGWIAAPVTSATPTDGIAGEEVLLVESSTEKTLAALPELPPIEETPVALGLWPRWRWLGLALGVLLSLGVLFLPQRAGHAVVVPELAPGLGTPIVSTPTTTEDGWQELSSLPIRRGGMGVVAADGKIYVIGGMTPEGTSDRVDIYTIKTENWQTATPRPRALGNVGAVVFGKKILVPGGCDVNWKPSSVVHVYDIEHDSWVEVAPLPKPLCAYALSVSQDQVYLFGGWDGNSYQAETYAYSPADDTWKKLSPSSVARAFGAAAALQDHIFYVGGYDRRKEWGLCEIYFPADDHWETCAPLLQPRGGLGLTEVGGQLRVVGGGWNTYLAFNERYNPGDNRWTVFKTPIVGQWINAGVTSWDGTVYVIGGWDGDYLNRTYKLEIFKWRIFIPNIISPGGNN